MIAIDTLDTWRYPYAPTTVYRHTVTHHSSADVVLQKHTTTHPTTPQHNAPHRTSTHRTSTHRTPPHCNTFHPTATHRTAPQHPTPHHTAPLGGQLFYVQTNCNISGKSPTLYLIRRLISMIHRKHEWGGVEATPHPRGGGAAFQRKVCVGK